MQAGLAFTAKSFGRLSLEWEPKNWSARCVAQTLSSSGRSQLPSPWHYAESGVYSENVSHSFLHISVWVFSQELAAKLLAV